MTTIYLIKAYNTTDNKLINTFKYTDREMAINILNRMSAYNIHNTRLCLAIEYEF